MAAVPMKEYGWMMVAVAAAGLLAPGTLRAEEAVLRDGRRMSGTLRLAPNGRMQFHPRGQPPRDLDQVERIRFEGKEHVSSQPWQSQRMLLRGGEHVSGEFMGLESESVRWRTGWGQQLRIVRQEVAAVLQGSGHLLVLADDLDGPLSNWRQDGKPRLAARTPLSPLGGVGIDIPGTSLRHRLTDELKAGWVALRYRETTTPLAARWLVEAEFQRADRMVPLSVHLAGDKAPGASVAGQWYAAQPSPRQSWHELVIEFSPKSLIVTIDDTLVCEHVLTMPAGVLRELRLACAASLVGGRAQGGLILRELRVARRMDPLPRPAGDLTQDEVWLRWGDQLFGELVRVDPHQCVLKARHGSRAFSWGDTRGVFFRQERRAPIFLEEGEHVSIFLASVPADELEGTVQAFDHKTLRLQHAVLGNLLIPTACVRQLRGLLHGKRMLLEGGLHHLGRQVLSTLEVPQPEGLAFRRSFQLSDTPGSARLSLRVHYLKGTGDGITAELARGALRTEVVLNGRTVDHLNRHVDRLAGTPRRLTIPLPRGALWRGENVLELRQTVDPATGRHEDCAFSNLVLELPSSP